MKAKLGEFDAVRGLAALVVVVCHIHVGFNKADESIGFSDLVDWMINPVHTFFFGEFAVYVFFVLSGFVLSLGVIGKDSHEPLIRLLIKRLPRLVLPILCTSLLFLIAVRLNLMLNHQVVELNHSTWFDQFWRVKISLVEWLYNCTLGLLEWRHYDHFMQINPALWTMPVELVFSFFLCACLWVSKHKKGFMLANALFLATLFYDDNRCYAFSFGLGFNLAVLYHKHVLNFGYAVSFCLVALAVVLATNVFGKFWGNELFFSLGAVLLLASIAFNQSWAMVLRHRNLVRLGEISFSLYLTHLLVLATVSSKLYIFLLMKTAISYEWTYAIVFFLSLLLALAFAKVVYEAIEKPSISFASLFAEKLMDMMRIKNTA